MTKKKAPAKDSKWEATKLGNLKYIPKMGSNQAPVTDFARIRSFNSKNEAITYDGLKVERQEFIYAEGYGLVTCVNYELHFVWEDKSKKIGRWAFMCSCGSIAGIISYKEMKQLMTVTGNEDGYILACIGFYLSIPSTQTMWVSGYYCIGRVWFSGEVEVRVYIQN